MAKVADDLGQRYRRWKADEEDEYVEIRPDASPLRRWGVALLVLALLIGAGIVAVRGWYGRQIDPAGPPGPAVSVEVPPGTSLVGVGPLLAGEDVISNAFLFRLWVSNKELTVQAGLYRFRESSSFDEALDVLRAGPLPPRVFEVTVPEGLTLPEIAEALDEGLPGENQEQLALTMRDPGLRSALQPPGQRSLEGLLFPSTYEIGRGESPASVVRRMVAEMERVVVTLGLQEGAERLGLSPYEVLVIASLIEEETGSVEESAKIARVIYNRLDEGMPLGIDATSRYLAESTGAPLDFESPSPYNTRRQTGLPPTPIAAPSRSSIEAALNPADGPWLYYVLEAPRRHLFTESAAEFELARQACIQKDLGCG